MRTGDEGEDSQLWVGFVRQLSCLGYLSNERTVSLSSNTSTT